MTQNDINIIAACIGMAGTITAALIPFLIGSITRRSFKIITIIFLILLPCLTGFSLYYFLKDYSQERIVSMLGSDQRRNNLVFPGWGFGIKVPKHGWYHNTDGYKVSGGTFHVYKNHDYKNDKLQYVKFYVECRAEKPRTGTVNQYIDRHLMNIKSMVKDLGKNVDPNKLVSLNNKVIEGIDCWIFEFIDPIKKSFYMEHHFIIDDSRLIIYKFKSYSSGYFEEIDPMKFKDEAKEIVESIKFDKIHFDKTLSKIND